MRDKIRWAMVADEAIARVMSLPDLAGDLEEVETLTDPDAHASGSDLRRDAHGRRSAGARAGTGATASASTDESHREAQQFAQQVAEWLNDAANANRFDELTIAAAPRFLGLLRKALSPQVTKLVVRQLDKDLIHESMGDLTTRFFREPLARS